MTSYTECANSPLYAVIDLGSNSFHMLITRQLADSVQVVDKVKRKVRLASGLDEHNRLSEQAIARGLECLSFFAERLQDIPRQNIRIVATATVRLATNRDDFLAQANQVLGHSINVLSGEDEARNIYLGVAHTNCSHKDRLVLDIGGASTEMIVGSDYHIHVVNSLNIGCVTFNNRFFRNGTISQLAFEQALAAAKSEIMPLVSSYQSFGWKSVLGGSGTMQALAELLMYQGKPLVISSEFLDETCQQVLAFANFDDIQIAGLGSERLPVLVSGLAILKALFECFAIEQLQLSSGALREGLLYEMLPDSHELAIRSRTINGLIRKFHIDTLHAERVLDQVTSIYQQAKKPWAIDQRDFELLKAATQLCEVGLLLEFKHHQKHGAYIFQHADLPGFDQADRQLLIALVSLYKGDIAPKLLAQQSATTQKSAERLLVILRLAVILCRRRKDDVLPSYSVTVKGDNITITLPDAWLQAHPLITDELHQESRFLVAIGQTLTISSAA
ncbi:Ppx/GppA phosphatase family protein [Thalassotalea fusca]